MRSESLATAHLTETGEEGRAGRPVPCVLIVDDEALIAWDLRSTVEGFGYRVCGVAATGPDAVRIACEHAPDLVLMDVRLRGDMDGIEATRRICDRRALPVIFITGNSDSITEARIRRAHPHAVILGKPIAPATLRATIADVLAHDSC